MNASNAQQCDIGIKVKTHNMQAMQLQLQICADWIVLCSQRTGGQNLGRGSIKIMILQLATSTTLEFFFRLSALPIHSNHEIV
jgi:hypothetical protein